MAVYGDVEFNDPGGQWTVGTAVRSEHFEDFGATTNGKLSARVGLTDVVSVRGAVSSGFRAPSPGQQHAFNVTTAFIGGQLTNNGVVPSTSAVAVARGGGQLQPETSINLSAGAVIERGPFLFTADFFRINIDDRVALSQEIALTEPEILTLLAEGIPEARNFPVFRFFLNDFSTTTQGVDLIASLAVGRTTVSAVFNYTDTTVKNIDSAVIDEFRINTLERGLPKTRWNVSLTHRADRWSLLGRLNYFGQYWDSEDGRNATDIDGGPAESWLYPAYAGKALIDLELGIPFGEALTLAVGGENVLNTYPDVNQYGAATVGNQYGSSHRSASTAPTTTHALTSAGAAGKGERPAEERPPELSHELVQRPAEYQLARLCPDRFGADPRQEQTREVTEGQLCPGADRHVERVWPIAPDVLKPGFWVRARQRAEGEQPRHEAHVGVRFARLDELIDLMECAEVVSCLERGRPRRQAATTWPLDRPGDVAEENKAVSFLLFVFTHRSSRCDHRL